MKSENIKKISVSIQNHPQPINHEEYQNLESRDATLLEFDDGLLIPVADTPEEFLAEVIKTFGADLVVLLGDVEVWQQAIAKRIQNQAS